MPKQIPPTLRDRNRYLAFEVISNSKVSRGDIVKTIWDSVLRLLGENGASKISLWVMDWDEEKKHGILKVNHKALNETRAALTLIKEINGEKTLFHIYGVSGTVKKIRTTNSPAEI